MVHMYNGICEKISLLDSKKLLTLRINVELHIIYVLIHLSPEYCSLNELNGFYKQRKRRWLYTVLCIEKSYSYTNTYIYMIWVNEGNKLWYLYYIFSPVLYYPLSLFLSLSLSLFRPNNCLYKPFSPNPIVW